MGGFAFAVGFYVAVWFAAGFAFGGLLARCVYRFAGFAFVVGFTVRLSM